MLPIEVTPSQTPSSEHDPAEVVRCLPKRPSYDERTEPLRRDIDRLGTCIGKVLSDANTKIFENVEYIRNLCWGRRNTEYSRQIDGVLSDRIDVLVYNFRSHAIRIGQAFSVFLNCANVAELVHRIRRRREMSIEGISSDRTFDHALQKLKDDGKSLEEVRSLIADSLVSLVFTAHPTEVVPLDRRNHFNHITSLLIGRLGDANEKEDFDDALQADIQLILASPDHRIERPTPLDEATESLAYISGPVWDAIVPVWEKLNSAMQNVYGEGLGRLPLHFRIWPGGDRDGNKAVTPEMTYEVLTLSSQLALKKHRNALTELMGQLSIGEPLPEEILLDLEKYNHLTDEHLHHPLRRFVAGMIKRLEDREKNILAGTTADVGEGYKSALEFEEDIHLLESVLERLQMTAVSHTYVRPVRINAEVFGFQIAELDIREDSGVLRRAMDSAFNNNPRLGSGYFELSEEAKQDELGDIIREDYVFPDTDSEDERSTLAHFDVLAKAHRVFGPECSREFIVSMTEHPSDILLPMAFASSSGLLRYKPDGSVISALNFVPLFEKEEALAQAPETIRSLLQNDLYRALLSSRENRLTIMLGYSDSAKDSGVLPAHWAIARAQQQIVKVAKEFGVEVEFFHGRGGAAGRGGEGTVRAAVTSLPPGTLNGRFQQTVQGEVANTQYGIREVAEMNLEELMSAVFEKSGVKENVDIPKDWIETMARLQSLASERFRSLINYDNDSLFGRFFRKVTPFNEITGLKIGSRDDKSRLRAIPISFAGTQNRSIYQVWYGAGSAFEAIAQRVGGLEQMQLMYEQWPWFHTVIDSMEMVLAKTDMNIARHYFEALDGSDEGREIQENLEREYERATNFVLQITKQESLLSRNEVLRESIKRRNPYTDAANFLQIAALKRLRDYQAGKVELSAPEVSDLEELVAISISAVAAGMRNTG